jgi:hypothetical protein
MPQPQKTELVRHLNNQTDDLFGHPLAIQDGLPGSEPPSKRLIERALEALGIVYAQEGSGAPSAVFSNEEMGWSMRFRFLLDGQTRAYFSVTGTLDVPIPERRVGEALLVCNHYAATCSFGRFSVSREAGQAGFTLSFDAIIDVTDGISQAFLQTFISSHIGTALAFLSRADIYNVLFPARAKARKKANGKTTGNGGAAETVTLSQGEARFRIVSKS